MAGGRLLASSVSAKVVFPSDSRFGLQDQYGGGGPITRMEGRAQLPLGDGHKSQSNLSFLKLGCGRWGLWKEPIGS